MGSSPDVPIMTSYTCKPGHWITWVQPSIFSLAAAVCVADTHKHAACPSLRALHTAVVSCLRYDDPSVSRREI